MTQSGGRRVQMDSREADERQTGSQSVSMYSTVMQRQTTHTHTSDTTISTPKMILVNISRSANLRFVRN